MSTVKKKSGFPLFFCCMKQKYRATLSTSIFLFLFEDKMQKRIIMAGFVVALLSQTSICNAADAGSATISLTDGIIVNKEEM